MKLKKKKSISKLLHILYGEKFIQEKKNTRRLLD